MVNALLIRRERKRKIVWRILICIFVLQVSISFDRSTAEPAENISLQISTDPMSLVNLLAVDQSVLLMATGNDVTQVDVRIFIEIFFSRVITNKRHNFIHTLPLNMFWRSENYILILHAHTALLCIHVWNVTFQIRSDVIARIFIDDD